MDDPKLKDPLSRGESESGLRQPTNFSEEPFSWYLRVLKRKKQQYHDWQIGVIMVSTVGTQISPFAPAWRDLVL